MYHHQVFFILRLFYIMYRHQGLCVTHLFPTFIFFFLARKRILNCLVHWRNLNKTNDVFCILFGFSHIGTSTDPQYNMKWGKNSSLYIRRIYIYTVYMMCVYVHVYIRMDVFFYFLLHSSQCRMAHNLVSL